MYILLKAWYMGPGPGQEAEGRPGTGGLGGGDPQKEVPGTFPKGPESP